MAFLRLAVRGDDEPTVGRAFSGAVVETSLSSYPGTFFTSAPSGPGRGPLLAHHRRRRRGHAPHHLRRGAVPPPTGPAIRRTAGCARHPHRPGARAHPAVRDDARDRGAALGPARGPFGGQGGRRQRGPVGRRRGGGPLAAPRFDVAAFKEALPEAAPFDVDRHPLPNLRAVNFVVHGILGWGVASNLRLDTQAKGLAELLRSRSVVVPFSLVSSGPAAARYTAWRSGA